MRSVLALLVLTALAASAADLPAVALAAGTWECHGTARLRGQAEPQRFWLRLLPPDGQFGGNRVLQAVYTPPVAKDVGGTHLAGVPFLLLDAQTRIVAWNERAGFSQVAPGSAYKATRDRTPEDSTELVTDERAFAGERGWDRTAAPLLLAIAWRAGTRANLPLVDLFGDEAASTVSWDGPAVRLAGADLRVEPDAAGRLARLVDAQGAAVVTVTAWLKEGTK